MHSRCHMMTRKTNVCQIEIKTKARQRDVKYPSVCRFVGMPGVRGWLCVGARFSRKHIKMSLHNPWLGRLLSSSHFRDPLPAPADMLNIEWGQNFCLEPLLSLFTSNTSRALHRLRRRCRRSLAVPHDDAPTLMRKHGRDISHTSHPRTTPALKQARSGCRRGFDLVAVKKIKKLLILSNYTPVR